MKIGKGKNLFVTNSNGLKEVDTLAVSETKEEISYIHVFMNLCKIPKTWLSFEHMLRLDAWGCGLVELPKNIGYRLQNLESLDVSKNELQSLPKSLGSLSKLRVLDVSNNHLKRLPPTLIHCEVLKFVGLFENSALPKCLTLHRGGNKLIIETNPIWDAMFTETFTYAKTRVATVAFLVLNKRKSLGNLHKDVVKHVIAPALYETRDDDEWYK